MKKKVLIAVDPSVHTRSALQYAAQITGEVREAAFVLFHVQPRVSDYLAEEAAKSAKGRAELESLNRKNKEDARSLLADLRQLLAAQGVDAPNIEEKTLPRRAGVAEDILNEAEKGRYDAVLVGRRGISAFQELFVGSVANNLLFHSVQIPVWVVDGKAPRGNVLIAVDGSVNSMRAVDHAAFMLEGNDRIGVEMLHVQPRLGDFCDIDAGAPEAADLQAVLNEANDRCLADFRAQAYRRLQEAGLTDSQIGFRETEKRLSPARVLLEELQGSGCGTLVIGRQGMSASRFMGRVAGGVVQRMKNRAVWVVP
jgi:nucleotide-binding universal stress UspA family protein